MKKHRWRKWGGGGHGQRMQKCLDCLMKGSSKHFENVKMKECIPFTQQPHWRKAMDAWYRKQEKADV